MSDLILSKPQAANLLGVHIATVHRLIKSGAIPHIKISISRIGILRTDIDAYLQSRRFVNQPTLNPCRDDIGNPIQGIQQ